ncbi:hypothetical protein [Oscillatoria sp. FACHB-1406]|uniref:hypothetical protein n=1 Tax=Oscillatoria sp. FACHB-1406 TaxID=2692846 RepID=UPI0016888169|nr:hypothetical protein [Oscillatoria sp. FACHB-1406]MBD2578594.1 hypothetical protein [Oscillatoria sp. FACHB-1406]
MSGNVMERSATGLLVLIIPVAFTVVFLYAAWPILLAIGVLALALKLWQTYAWQQLSAQVNPFFNQLVKENQGCLTPLDLAATANLNASTAKHYLEKKAEEYGAQRKEIRDRGSVYYFLTASSLGSILDASEPFGDIDSEDAPEVDTDDAVSAPVQYFSTQDGGSISSLIQADLAKRLNVKDYKISRYKTNDDFGEWTQKLDPEGIAWKYQPEDRMFIPQV